MPNKSYAVLFYILLSCFVLFPVTCVNGVSVYAAETETELDRLLDYYSTKNDLTDWEAVVLGINGIEIKTPWFTTPYFERVENEVREKNGEYRTATEYARLVIVYQSHGKDPSRIAGYDFIEILKQFENMQNQGINAYTWTLIALKGQSRETVQPLIDSILAYQTPAGGFSFTRNPDASASADADLTAMAVTALAPYVKDSIQSSVDKAVAYLTARQNDFTNCETVAQVVIALCSAGLEPDAALTEMLESYRLEDGFYTHLKETSKADAIATYQAALALTAVERFNTGQGGVYE